MVKEFKQFILQGNVVDLAVGIVIGVAFNALVDALVSDFITPLIGAFGGEPNFSGLDFTINDSRFLYGHFINEAISFLIVAAVIFFFVVKPMNMLVQRARSEPPTDPTTKKCPECLSEIAIGARRCAFCTAQITA